MDVVTEDMKLVGVKQEESEDERGRRSMIGCGDSCREKQEEKEDKEEEEKS